MKKHLFLFILAGFFYVDANNVKNTMLSRKVSTRLAIDTSFLESVDRTRTAYGRESLKKLLLNPLTQAQEKALFRRQDLIKTLVDSPELLVDIDSSLMEIADNQDSVTSLLSLDNSIDTLSDLQSILNKLFGVQGSKFGMEAVRSVTNLFLVFSAGLFVPDMCCSGYKLYKDYSNKHSPIQDNFKLSVFKFFSTYSVLSGFLFGKLVPKSLDSEKINLDTQALIIGLKGSLEAVKKLGSSIEKIDNFPDVLKYCKILDSKEINENLKNLMAELQANTFEGKLDTMSFMGRVRLAYKYATEVKNYLDEIFKAVGEIDAFVSASKLVLENKNKSLNYCFTDFVRPEEGPVFSVINSWNPVLDIDNIIPESISLGHQEGFAPNILLNGAYGDGKSTFMKQIAYNIILSQVFGICAAEKCSATLFSLVSVHLGSGENLEKNLQDFSSECQKLRKLKFDVRSLSDTQFSFVLIDEPFKGCLEKNVPKLIVEFMEKMAKISGNICVMANNFTEPIEYVESLENAKFKIYHMDLSERTPGRFKLFFKLKEGKSPWWFTDFDMRFRYINWLQASV